MRAPLLIFIFFCFTGDAFSQAFCSRTIIFFDQNKSSLAKRSASKLDSLAVKLNSGNYFIELVGYADSSDHREKNLRLSLKRIAGVKSYMAQRIRAKVTWKEMNQGETVSRHLGSGEENLAYSRRVEIFITPMNNDKVVLKGKYGEEIRLSQAYFEDCGFCNLQPQIRMMLSAEEAKENNVTFESTAGEKLISGGMISLDHRKCQGISYLEEITFKILADRPDPEMSLWEPDTVNGKIRWKESKISLGYDSTGKQYVFRIKGIPFYHLAKKLPPPKKNIYRIIYEGDYHYIHSFLKLNGKNEADELMKDSIEFDDNNPGLIFNSFIQKDEKNYFFIGSLKDIHLEKDSSARFVYHNYKIRFSDYKPFPVSDTVLKVSFKGVNEPDQVGFYLKEYNEFLPFQKKDGKYFIDKKIEKSFILGFTRNNKLYAQDEKEQGLKVKRRKNLVKITITSRSAGNFKWINTYNVRLH